MQRYVSLLAIAGAVMAADRVAADILVTDWDLLVNVYESGSGDQDYALFTTPQTPFVAQHDAGLHTSTAAAQYRIAYLANSGSFHITSQQQATGLASSTVFTEASGNIWLSTTEPLPLHIDASWTYSLPADFMMTQFGVHINGESSQTVLFHQSYNEQTMPGEPSSDTLPILGDVIIPPGETWIIQYRMFLLADQGTQNHSATGNGYVNLTITPEPGSLCLLALGSLPLLRRRSS